MCSIEKVRVRILKMAEAAATAGNPFQALLRPWELANEFDLGQNFVRDELLHLAHIEFIELFAYDGERNRPLAEWPSPQALFDATTDSGLVRVRLTSAGKEYLERIPPETKIGFAT
jgi:hypothetical protein